MMNLVFQLKNLHSKMYATQNAPKLLAQLAFFFIKTVRTMS